MYSKFKYYFEIISSYRKFPFLVSLHSLLIFSMGRPNEVQISEVVKKGPYYNNNGIGGSWGR